MPERADSRRRVALILALAVAALGCQTTAPLPTDVPQLTVPDVDEQALLLLLADREIYEGFSVNKGLEALIMKMLAKDPADRPATADELKLALERLADLPEMRKRAREVLARLDRGEL